MEVGYPSKREADKRLNHGGRGSLGSNLSLESMPNTVADVVWVAAFGQLKNAGDGEVHKDSLADLLILIGHPAPDQSLARSIADNITSYNYMDETQAYAFIRAYEAKLHVQLRQDFTAVAQKHGGKMPLPKLEALVTRKGYTPIPHAIHEVLTECAAELGENIGDGLSLKVFVKVMDTLEQNQGFCKSDLNIIEGAFQQFDLNNDGFIYWKELRPLLESIDFFVDAGVVEKLVVHFFEVSGGRLTWQNFLSISRKRVQLEFDLCQSLFKKCDDDKDGLLQPGEVMRMVSKLGVSLLPETLVDLMEECNIDDESLDNQAVWKMLQVLRAREGFTQSEAAEIQEVFARFDSSGRGKLQLKRVPAAISWLGYLAGPGVMGKAHKHVELPSTAGGCMTEAQFLRLVRKHREAQMKCIRKVFRSFATDSGAGKLQMENLQAAITRLNRLFVNDFLDWIKTFRPGARFARRHVSFDFEDFRMIALHCVEQNKLRVHKNCGFAEIELSKLRIEFVKYTKDDSSTEVDASGLMRLFKALIPEAQTTPTVHKRLKKAVDNENAHNSGVDWHGFLRVMMAYLELTEASCERKIRTCLESLNLPSQFKEDAHCILQRICHGSDVALPTICERRGDKLENPVTPAEMKLLLQGLAPRLTNEEASEVLEQVQETNTAEGELMGLKQMKSIVLSSDLSKRSNPKAHDLL